ncbi:hypothetical protein EST38_g5374 [Candolleomyces aberdarensis]|uniref:Uncharacterized protein n=1 Tax=Candolleomyces aberdarensis TaxID=2316362 RepID=A0A4V1Q412_9AGAR|nr:hypothetical protein EST38_g5374 [Candolleomyces aberdarensis]
MPATPAPTSSQAAAQLHPVASTSFTPSLSPHTRLPSTDNGSESHRRPRPVPSRLNLSGISNHTPHSSPSNDTAQPLTAIAVCLTPTSPRLPSNSSNSMTPGPAAYQMPPPQTSGTAISLSVHQETSTSTSTSGASNNTIGAPPDRPAYRSNALAVMVEENSNSNEGSATAAAGEPKDRQSVGTSTLLDSPSTKAMMDRLLAAPDYFSANDPSGLEALDDDDDDDDDVSSGSLKFARGDVEDEDELVSRRVREQRDRAKVKKLLGTDDSTEDFSRPHYVQGFWSDPDTGLNEIRMRRKVSAGSGIPRAQGRSPGVKVGSPRNPGVLSTSISSPTMPPDGYSGSREQGATDSVRKSEDGRTQSRQLYHGATPPVSPPWNYHPSPSNRTRVPALDSLQPDHSSGSIRRSKTISGAIDCAPPSPPVTGGYLQPPPRVSSRNALNPSKLSKRKSSRSPSPNVILTPQSNAPTPIGSPKNQRDFSPRIKSSKSSKSLSSFKPQLPAPTATPAGAIAEQYKRQILETQDAAQSSVKERRRLSALKWMIEQTKSVTGGSKSSPGSSKSASPRLTDAKASSPAVASKLSKDDSSPRSTGPGRLDTGVPALPSPFSATTNESSVSLTLPESRPARTSSRPGAVGRGIRSDEPRSPVLGGYADSPGRSSSSFALPRSPATDEHFSEEFGGAAYCAIVGAHVGHWNASSASRAQRSSTSKPSGKEKGSFSLGLGRRLSKKRSAKRSNGPEVVEVVSPTKANQDGIPRNRPRGRSVLVVEREKDGGSSGSSGNVRARRGHSLEKPPPLRHRRSLRLSIDKFADEETSTPALTQRANSSPGHSHPSKKPSASGSHFWKLVKRIGSSGGLRDKYQANDGATHSYLPLSQAASLSAVSPEVDGNDILTQLPSPSRRPSLDGSSRVSKVAVPPTRKRSASVLKQASSSADGHISYTRPPQHSINTRSSTPASDHTSRVYHRTHSTRSSASSFADLGLPPPLPHPPSAFLGQRNFGSRSDGGHSSDSGHPSRPSLNKSSPLTASSNQRTPTDEDRMAFELVASFQTPPSLPTPPRRPKPVVLTSFPSTAGHGEYSEFEAESPVIPEFSVNNAINQFKPRNQSGDGVNVNPNPLSPNDAQNTTQSLEAFPVLPPMMITPSTSVPPPPRPARDARRPTPSSADGRGTGAGGTRKDSGLDSNSGQKQKSNQPSSQHAGYTGYGSKPPTSAFGPLPLFSKTHQQPGVSEHHQQQQAPPLPKRSNSSSPASPSTSIGSTAHTPSPVFRDLQSSSSARGAGGVGLGVALSEREKAERWNELLERSEKAGGTLHISLANNLDSHLCSASPLSTPTSAMSSGMMDFK